MLLGQSPRRPRPSSRTCAPPRSSSRGIGRPAPRTRARRRYAGAPEGRPPHRTPLLRSARLPGPRPRVHDRAYPLSRAQAARRTQVVVGSIERRRELARVAIGLGEDQATLDLGQRRPRQRGGVGVWVELAARLHRSQAVANLQLPARERGGQVTARLLVALGQLTDQRPDGAAATALALD